MTEDCDCSDDETQPILEVTMGEVSVYAQGRSCDSLEELGELFDKKYQRALEDYLEITEEDDPRISAH